MSKVLIRASVLKKMGSEFAAYQKTLKSFLADPHQHGLNFEKLEGSLGAQKTYSIRHNKKKRLALCPISHNGQQIWVVTDFLPRHQYAKLKPLDEAEKASLLADMTAGSFDQEEAEELVVDVSNNVELFNNRVILLDDYQVQVRDKELSSLPLIISGAPGSGKTSVLLSIVKNHVVNATSYEEPLPILIIAKSAQLVEFMRAEWAASAEADGVELKRVVFKTPEEIYTDNFGPATFRGENDFVLWYENYSSIQNKLNQDNKTRAALPGTAKAALIYQEFHTMSGYETFDDYEQAINSSFSLFAEKSMRARLWDVYQGYKEHLKTGKEIDLSFEPITLKQKYEFVGLDETQDLSRLQIKSLAKSTSRLIFSIGDHQRLFGSETTIPFLRTVFWEQFKEDVTTHKVLKASYRCPKEIIEVANGILQLKYQAIGGTSFLDKNELSYIEANPNHSQIGAVQWLEQQKELLPLIEANKNNVHFVVITPDEFLDEAIALFGKERVFTSANFKGLQAKQVLLYKPLSQEGFKAASSAIGESFVIQEPPAAIAKSTTGSIRHSTLFNELFVATTRAEERLLVFQPYEHPSRLVINPLKTVILAKNSGKVHTQPTTESSKEEWLAHAKILRENNQHAHAAAIEARFQDAITIEQAHLILPIQAQPNTQRVPSAGLTKNARNLPTTMPSKEQVKVVGANAYNRQKKQDKTSKGTNKFNKKLHPVEAFLSNEAEALNDLIKHKEAISYLFDLQLDTINPNLPAVTLVDYLAQPINKEKKDQLIIGLINQLNTVASWKNLSKDQQSRQDSLMMLLYAQPTKCLPLGFDVLKVLSKDSLAWNFMSNFKKNRVTAFNDEITQRKFNAVANLKQLGLINTPDNQGFTLIHVAAHEAQDKLVEALVAQGANINQMTRAQETPLYLAASKGNARVVRTLVRLGADFNLKNKDDISPLCIAAKHGRINVVEALVELGGDVNEMQIIQYKQNKLGKSDTSYTPIHTAACEGHVEMVKTLVRLGAKVNLANELGMTPLYMATYRGKIAVMKKLVELGADINDMVTALQYAPLHIAACNGQVKVVEAVVALGAEINLRNTKNGITPLYLAAMKGHVEVVNTLGALGASINLGNIQGDTPLHTAVDHGHLKVIEALITLGADINLAADHGSTVLHLAAYQGNIEIINTLIRLGADVNKAIKQSEAPLHTAARKGHMAAVRALVEAGANINQVCENSNSSALFLAAQYGHLDIVTYLLANNASSFIVCKTKAIFLMNIASSDEAKARAKEFIESKDQTLTSTDEFSILPVEIAYIMGYLEIAQCLQNNMSKQEKTLNTNHMFYTKKENNSNGNLDLDTQKAIPR